MFCGFLNCLDAANCHLLFKIIREIKVSSDWFWCVLVTDFFPCSEGTLGIGYLVVFLFHQCITYCNKCKLCSKWHGGGTRKVIIDLDGSFRSRYFLYTMNERKSFGSWASAFESPRLVIGLKWTSDQKVACYMLPLLSCLACHINWP